MFRVYKSTEFCSVSLNSNDDSEMTEAGVARPELLKAVFSARINWKCVPCTVLHAVLVRVYLKIVTIQIRTFGNMALMTARWLGTFVKMVIKIPEFEIFRKGIQIIHRPETLYLQSGLWPSCRRVPCCRPSCTDRALAFCGASSPSRVLELKMVSFIFLKECSCLIMKTFMKICSVLKIFWKASALQQFWMSRLWP